MKIKLFINKKHNLKTPELALNENGRFYETGHFEDVKDENDNLVYENKSATVAYAEGEEIPQEYLTGNYIQRDVEISDDDVNTRLSTFSEKGYKGDSVSMAKLMAMDMDDLSMTRAADVSVLPTTNLHYYQVRDTLNVNGGSVNNNMASLFKESAKINRWSKYKPVILNQNFCDTDDRYKGSSGLCGFDVQRTVDLLGLCQGYVDNTFWVYKLPTGGSSSPYRLGDFRGYYPEAKPFIRSNIAKGKQITIPANTTQRFTFDVNTDDDKSLCVKDFDRNADMMLGKGAKIGAAIFFSNPLVDIPTSMSPYVFYSEPITGDESSVNIDINFEEYSAYTKIYLLFFMQDSTTNYRFTGLPYDDENYVLLTVNITNDPSVVDGYDLTFGKVYFYSYGVEFTNYVNLNEFSSSMPNHKTLQLQDAGDFRLIIHLSVGNIKDFIIYDKEELYLKIDNKELTQFYIYSVDANSEITYPYTVSKNTSVDIELRSFGTYVLPQLEDGVNEFGIFRKGQLISNPIESMSVDVDFYPFN